VYWAAERTAMLADPHFGKAWSFRQAGIPVPAGTTDSAVARLSRVIAQSDVRRVVILGDFFHAPAGRVPALMDALQAWRSGCLQIEVVLVPGNHDRRAGAPPPEWRFQVVPELKAGPFLLRHEPASVAGAYVLAGHVHPVVRLADGAGATLRAPCFFFGPRFGILPAFGPFTGGHPIQPTAADRVIAVGPAELVDVSRPCGADSSGLTPS
jgi:DNA ligase-associated metallophosphoesterase